MKRHEREELLETLRDRFLANPLRHPDLAWDGIQQRLVDRERLLKSLLAMETTGGEPDVIGYESQADSYVFCDCAAQSPSGRRSLCYDRAALDARKQNKPAGSAADMAAEMGIELMNEEQYRQLQSLGEFDTKTSSWLWTPSDVRKPGGALFGDRRYGRVFVYHNGAESYYAARGFRGVLRIGR
ncbi:MAG: DUF4256 domain-containing protein [Pirellulales bacterium]